MRLAQFALFAFVVIASTMPAAAASHPHRGGSSARSFSKRAAKSKPKPQGQRNIDDERATQIQSALIKAGYLSGEPSGHWDVQTQSAMVKMQSDNGWQTKLVPDSRALIKLGLGPSAASSDPLAIQPNVPGYREPGAIARR